MSVRYTRLIAVVLGGAALLWSAEPTSADEVYYKWQDNRGQWHYSNAANPSAVKVLDLSGVENAPVEQQASARYPGAAAAIERYTLRRESRRVRREIREIDDIFANVRQQQRERFESYNVSHILQAWQVASLGTELRERKKSLSAELARLEDAARMLPGRSGDAARLAPARGMDEN